MDFGSIDQQLAAFGDRLRDEVRLRDDRLSSVASTVAAEVAAFDLEAQAQVRAASPVPLADRLEELRAFQAWMDFASRAGRGDPAVARAQVVVQNYVCFVYLGESCFRALCKTSRTGSTTRRCCEFLTENPVRALRNAIAHSHWTYRADFRALVYWARKGSDPHEPMTRFEVEQTDLDFWQSLSRGVAYAAYSSLERTWTPAASG